MLLRLRTSVMHKIWELLIILLIAGFVIQFFVSVITAALPILITAAVIGGGYLFWRERHERDW